MCKYFFFQFSEIILSFLSDAPHIIKLKFQEIKNTVSTLKNEAYQNLCFSSLFQQTYGDFVICFEIYEYFLAFENDEWVFLTSKNHGAVPLILDQPQVTILQIAQR